MRLNLPLQSA